MPASWEFASNKKGVKRYTCPELRELVSSCFLRGFSMPVRRCWGCSVPVLCARQQWNVWIERLAAPLKHLTRDRRTAVIPAAATHVWGVNAYLSDMQAEANDGHVPLLSWVCAGAGARGGL